MSQPALYSLATLMTSQERSLEEETSRLVKRASGKLLEFHVKTSGDLIVVSSRISIIRDQICFPSWVFTRSRFLTDRLSFLDRKHEIMRFSYSSACEVTDMHREVKKGVLRTLSGYRRERLGVHYFNKLKKLYPAIRGVRLASAEEDREAVDLVVSVSFAGEKLIHVPVQVKSDVQEQEHHLMDPRRCKVPSMVIPGAFAYSRLVPHMKELLREYAVEKRVVHIRPSGSRFGVQL